ncbi:conserved hypothetical protein [Vibrio phage 120E34-1]|nr:conserved hypothetical protein [Vibrio phage 120E34-1]
MIKIGDKVKVTGTGGIYTTYKRAAKEMGSKLYKENLYPKSMTFDVIEKNKHHRLNEMVYLLKNDEGEFLFTDKSSSVFHVIKSKQEPAPTKFVKVEESIFDLREEFERGELYAVSGREKHFVINNEGWLTNAKSNGNVYRQVKVDWREIVIELAPSGYGIKALGKNNLRIDGAYNKEQALILANAIIESLTKKPEGV